MRFFICEHCKNIITFVEDSGVPVMCCGQKMTELVANTTDAAQEKHVPVVEKDGDKLIVSVGSVEHPMTEEHISHGSLLRLRMAARSNIWIIPELLRWNLHWAVKMWKPFMHTAISTDSGKHKLNRRVKQEQ